MPARALRHRAAAHGEDPARSGMPATAAGPRAREGGYARTMGETSGSAAASAALRLTSERQKRVLDPVERFSEVIFGLIMVLTFTCAFSVAQSGRQEVRQMLVEALGCNLAWGLVDAVMYVITAVVERTRRAVVVRGIRAADRPTAQAIVAGALPEGLVEYIDEAERDRLIERVRAIPEPKLGSVLRWEDFRGAIASGLLLLLATFPPVIPFLLVQGDPARALRISNAVAIACLFLVGYWLGRATGVRAWLLGLAMVVLGSGLVGLTILLGG